MCIRDRFTPSLCWTQALPKVAWKEQHPLIHSSPIKHLMQIYCPSIIIIFKKKKTSKLIVSLPWCFIQVPHLPASPSSLCQLCSDRLCTKAGAGDFAWIHKQGDTEQGFSCGSLPGQSGRESWVAEGSRIKSCPHFTFPGQKVQLQPEGSSPAWNVSLQMLKPLSIFCLCVCIRLEALCKGPFQKPKKAFCCSLRACKKFCWGNSESINTDFSTPQGLLFLFTSIFKS